jgi:hypothetical protein
VGSDARALHWLTVSNSRHRPTGRHWASLPRELRDRAKLLRPAAQGTGPELVRNVTTEQVLLCCWGPCQNPGSNRIQLRRAHENPRWRDETTGQQEMLIYIFCSERCRDRWRAEADRRHERPHLFK